MGTPTAHELAEAMAISRPTLSRYVAAAGEQLCRMGRARATRYARTRRVEAVGTAAPVHRVDRAGAIIELGSLHFLDSGRQWLELRDGTGVLFQGLPPFAVDMAPDGFLGAAFAGRNVDLGLPASLRDWNDDHRLIALCRRGEDCIGDVILGTESLTRHLSARAVETERSAYPDLADGAVEQLPGSSAGGEQPKFAVRRGGHHFLVKFGPPSTAGILAVRWSDLLRAEALALAILSEADVPASGCEVLERKGRTFLEVSRFDRVGARGRRAVVSLRALDNEYLGAAGTTWAELAAPLAREGLIDEQSARWMVFADAFGQLIANSDRHAGNLSFFDDTVPRRLAPIYDMLPMAYAPTRTGQLVERDPAAAPPSALTLNVWHPAAAAALRFWDAVATSADFSGAFRAIARAHRKGLAAQIKATPAVR